jgi:ABC-type glycerol-3-phosphate transport system permease component
MPVMNKIERKSLWGKIAISLMYMILILGGITMVYPFVLMLSGSICSGIDSEQYQLIPSFLYNNQMLFLKYGETKYGTKFSYNPTRNINRNWRTGFSTLSNMPSEEPKRLKSIFSANHSELPVVTEWKEFARTVGLEDRIRCLDNILENDFRVYLLKKFKSSENVKRNLDVDVEILRLPYEYPYRRNWSRSGTAYENEYLKFLESKGLDKWTQPVMFDGEFMLYLRSQKPNIEDINKKYGTSFKSFAEICFTPKAPKNGLRSEWDIFFRKRLPFKYCRLIAKPETFRLFIQRSVGSVKKYNLLSGKTIKSFKEIIPSETQPTSLFQRTLWREYLTQHAETNELVAATVDNRFRDALKNKYRSIDKYNNACKTRFAAFEQITVPVAAADAAECYPETLRWKLHFLFNNYIVVWRYIAVNGRALWNTLILCTCTILAQLTVNPMCAYALSRFGSKHTYKVLMLLVATMAFPPMVLMIPNFFFMRQLGMLNTYAALIIPSMASGYYIFLMKGFFDSLPRELFEAASIEGASEFTMFTKITLPLVKPIMAVKALSAFTVAYGGFMWAFIICQDPKMWTIMVYLYQFQRLNPYHLTMASLVLASLPMLIMFLFCQKIIMRGIVIPVMK